MLALLISLVATLGVCSALAGGLPGLSIDVIPGRAASGLSTAQYTSFSTGFDGPKVSPINTTVFDWWYWDVVASDLSASAVLTVFTAEPTGLWEGLPEPGSATWFGGMFTFPNGTPYVTFLPAEKLTVLTIHDGSSGAFDGINGGWTGTPDMSKYIVSINEPEAGIQGTLTLSSIAPAHLPCSSSIDDPGQPLTVSPELGWANAVPDADGDVDFLLGGTRLHFSGPGYHDKNWGHKPVNVTIKSWYWGHARVGPYSIVWFDVVAPDGTEHVSSYVSRDGKVVTASCSGISVRPTGANATYPPTPGSPLPDGFHIEQVVLGEGTLVLEAKNTRFITGVADTSFRWLGSVSGGFENRTQWEGVGLYEAFAFDI